MDCDLACWHTFWSSYKILAAHRQTVEVISNVIIMKILMWMAGSLLSLKLSEKLVQRRLHPHMTCCILLYFSCDRGLLCNFIYLTSHCYRNLKCLLLTWFYFLSAFGFDCFFVHFTAVWLLQVIEKNLYLFCHVEYTFREHFWASHLSLGCWQ